MIRRPPRSTRRSSDLGPIPALINLFRQGLKNFRIPFGIAFWSAAFVRRKRRKTAHIVPGYPQTNARARGANGARNLSMRLSFLYANNCSDTFLISFVSRSREKRAQFFYTVMRGDRKWFCHTLQSIYQVRLCVHWLIGGGITRPKNSFRERKSNSILNRPLYS